jgi:hypothetical protein
MVLEASNRLAIRFASLRQSFAPKGNPYQICLLNLNRPTCGQCCAPGLKKDPEIPDPGFFCESGSRVWIQTQVFNDQIEKFTDT